MKSALNFALCLSVATLLAACGNSGSDSGKDSKDNDLIRMDSITHITYSTGSVGTTIIAPNTLTWMSTGGDGQYMFDVDYQACREDGRTISMKHFRQVGPAHPMERVFKLLRNSRIEHLKKSDDSSAHQIGSSSEAPAILTIYYSDHTERELNLTDLGSNYRFSNDRMTTATDISNFFVEENPFVDEFLAAYNADQNKCRHTK